MLKLAHGRQTDKGTDHSYLVAYDVLFKDLRVKANNVLEVGVDTGDSLRLWADYFCCAEVWGIDMKHIDPAHPRIHTLEANAYASVPAGLPMMDVIIDDGSHKKEDMLSFLRLYLPLLTKSGVMVIEDIPDPDWCWELREAVPKGYVVDVYDWRLNKGRFDDILMVISLDQHTLAEAQEVATDLVLDGGVSDGEFATQGLGGDGQSACGVEGSEVRMDEVFNISLSVLR